MQSSTCRPLMMTSSLLLILRSSLPLLRPWTLLRYHKMHVAVRSPPNGLNFHPLAVLILFIVRTVVSLRLPIWQMTFRLLASSTRSLQRPLHSFPSTSKLSLTSRLLDLDVAPLQVYQTVSPASMLRARSRQPRILRFHTPRPI